MKVRMCDRRPVNFRMAHTSEHECISINLLVVNFTVKPSIYRVCKSISTDSSLVLIVKGIENRSIDSISNCAKI